VTGIHEERLELAGEGFQVLRAGRGPLVVVLHGFPDHPPTFAAVIDGLAAAGYEVAAPWLRGYAPSTSAGPYHVEQLADDVLALADALGHRRFAVLGHDWGALIGYALCARAPARLTAAVTMAVPHPRAFLASLGRSAQLARSWYMLAFQLPGAARLARARDLALLELLWRRWSPGFRLDAARRRALHDCLAASLPAPIEYYRAMLRPAGAVIRRIRNGDPLLAPLATPLLQLQGADDGCVAPAACRGQARWFRGPFAHEVLAGAGHFLQVEVPEIVVERTLGWLAVHDRRLRS
jgi:pimeloyl-ACP methyl ester carboxylesterase